MQLGFVGLGSMGGPMTRNVLEAGHRVAVFDTDRDAMGPLVEAGARATDGVHAVAAESDVVILSLPSPGAVEAVVTELAGALDEGDVVVDTSTVPPSVTEANAAVLADSGVRMLGAPVSGGVGDALEAGRLTVMIGGDSAVVERCRPAFEAVATDIFHIGEDPADGHRVKLLNNYLAFAGFVATAEAVIVGQEAGLDVETMLSVFSASSGRNSSTETNFPEYVAQGSFDSGAALHIIKKDAELATAFAAEVDTPMLLGDVVADIVGYAHNRYGSDGDYLQIYGLLEDLMTDRE
jgi:3-hydroxyisobutyrate dehydrogenase-like beta-hydroxyacid dehydrogenase